MDIKNFIETTLDIKEGVPFCIKERNPDEDYDMPEFYVYQNNKIYNIDDKEHSCPDILSKVLKGEVFIYRQPKNHMYELHKMFNMKYDKRYALYENEKFKCYVSLSHDGIHYDDAPVSSDYLLEKICDPCVEIKEEQLPEVGQCYFYIDKDKSIKKKEYRDDAIDVAMQYSENMFLNEETAKRHIESKMNFFDARKDV
jgi:hypothetical protein